MIHKTISNLFANMASKPVDFKPSEVIDAFRKVDRILDDAYLPIHVNSAERMFHNMLKRYGFNNTDRASPLICGMQDHINARRAEIDAEWEAMDKVA